MKRLVIASFVISMLVTLGCKPKEIVIGAILPESGEAALYGQAVKEGIMVAEAYVKSSQDYPYRFRVIYRDTKSQPDAAAELMNDVIKEGALAVIGGVTSSEAFKMAEIAAKRTRVLLSPTASHAKLSGINPYFFRIYPSDQQEVIRMAKHTAEIVGATKIAILYQNNEYGDGVAENYALELKKLGILNAQKIVLPTDAESFSDPISEALALNPDAVFIAAYSDITIRVLQDLKAVRYKGTVLTTSAINTPGAFARAGESAENIYYCKPPFETGQDGGEKSHIVDVFTKKYEEQFGKMPDVFAAYGFDSFLVLATAISQSGTYPEDVYKGLKGLQGFTGVTGPVVFNTYGDVNKFPRIYWYTQGQEVDYMEYRKNERDRILKEIERLRSGQN
ncbi:MAG TPA: penicillin-binding protein activator [Thermoanaerobaculia bacterium]|nr:penicillin-binding protein activator [Thermoanaerobaculia bacterium]HUM29473.1 penicillin-binding protein activator [Thermoanaerobaculia bacterium]HXK67856.1 penicillin-binding protein activator [Thermoanaerobaculia bacterium]